ncbi:MAG: hypothetical protein HC889_10525 [Synechococcaceae cyanobacterium SM1_2_3]|nr:hypothetical protein [Synechococcaceae cyanobacterium SM1_2_3]
MTTGMGIAQGIFQQIGEHLLQAIRIALKTPAGVGFRQGGGVKGDIG